jgi:flagellar export protein FliJ
VADKKTFRYKTLLRVRRREEEVKALALAQTMRRLGRARRERDEIVARQRAMLGDAQRMMSGAFDASDVLRFYQFEQHLARLAVEKDALILELTGEERARRAELEEAVKRKKMIERLKEHHQEMLRTERAKEEQRLLDDVAAMKAALAGVEGRP